MVDLLIPWQTPSGIRFLLASPPWTRNTLLLWDAARGSWGWPSDLSVMPAPEALAYLDAAEAAHVRHGFHVRPGWRGLKIPPACPVGVALDLQAAFMCSADAPGGAR